MSLKGGDLYTYLKTVSGLTALVGTGDDARIYPGKAPQGVARPYVTYQRISNVGQHHATAAAAIASPVFQIDVWAATPLSAHNTAEAVRDGLDGYRGTMGTTDVRSVQKQDERDGYENPSDGSQSGTWRVSLDYRFWHVETVPTF